jgi:hypothetical protein
MKNFNFIVMSIDPLEDEDDNSQKYSKSAVAKTSNHLIRKKNRFYLQGIN